MITTKRLHRWIYSRNVRASTLLINSFGHSVDAKGRVFIPAKWRDDLGDTVIITRDMMGKGDSRCLYGMPVSVWNEILERFRKIAMADQKAQNAMRMLFANASDCELDKQGRILMPSALREYAGIGADAMLIGMGNRIEIWGADKWKKHCRDAEEASDEINAETMAYLAGLGI